MKRLAHGLLCAAALAAAACSPREPVRIGFLGGLSGRVADLGEAGRNGALLAVEQANAAGGLDGREVVMLIHDDEQNEAVAVRAVEAMAREGVKAIVGPMTSSVAEAILPVATRLNMVCVSPTVSASTLAGKDDLFFKVAPLVEVSTRRISEADWKRGARRVAIAFDTRNRAFSADWAAFYRRDFTALGGSVVAEAPFASGDDASYGAAIQTMAAARPDTLLLVASAVDVVRMVQLARNRGMKQHVSTSTWAATENLIQLGGRTVEGLSLPQFFNRDDRSARYLAFAAAFRARFNQEPGFASVAAYDAATATLAALRAARSGPLKAALLSGGPYEGAQESWRFDANGDTRRATHMTVVRDGRFVLLD